MATNKAGMTATTRAPRLARQVAARAAERLNNTQKPVVKVTRMTAISKAAPAAVVPTAARLAAIRHRAETTTAVIPNRQTLARKTRNKS